MPKGILNQFKYVLTECELREIKKLNLDLNKTFLLIYFINQNKPILNLEELHNQLNLNEEEVMEAFNYLLSNNLIEIKMKKNNDKKLEEIISLDPFYERIESELKEKNKETKITKIFQIFESEFGRPLSPMEYELIDGWLKSSVNEELLIGALKEATFNGVRNFRYIDKIIYEWTKKGFKSMKDVESNIRKQPEKTNNQDPLFDYNWLDDDK